MQKREDSLPQHTRNRNPVHTSLRIPLPTHTAEAAFQSAMSLPAANGRSTCSIASVEIMWSR